MHILLVHRLHQQADSRHHDYRVRSLDANNHIIELFTTADSQKLHATLHDTLGRVAIARHDTVRQRAVVDTNANSGVVFFADIEERH